MLVMMRSTGLFDAAPLTDQEPAAGEIGASEPLERPSKTSGGRGFLPGLDAAA